MAAKTKTKPAAIHEAMPEVGDLFRYRGFDYIVDVVDVAGNGITIRRPDHEAPQPGYMRLVSGSLSNVLYAPDGGFHHFHGTVAQSMRGEPMIDLQRVIQFTRDNGGRDDLAIAKHYGEARGVPGTPALTPAAPLIATVK